jgi:hypothetical protein
VVPIPVVVQVVLAWCPFTQWEQHFAQKTTKNCSLRGEATIFINWPNERVAVGEPTGAAAFA